MNIIEKNQEIETILEEIKDTIFPALKSKKKKWLPNLWVKKSSYQIKKNSLKTVSSKIDKIIGKIDELIGEENEPNEQKKKKKTVLILSQTRPHLRWKMKSVSSVRS